MPIDASIALGGKPPQIESPLNAMAQVLQIQQAQGQNALAQYSLSKAQRGDADMNALMQHLANGGDLSTPEGQAAAFRVAPLSAPALIKSQLESRKIGAEADKNSAEATTKAVALHRDALAGVNDPATAAQWVQAAYQNPALKSLTAATPLDKAISLIPQDPAGFQQWKQQMSLGATKFMELNKPTYQTRNTGATTDTIQLPGLGGAPQVVSTIKNTQSPDAQLQASTSRANNAATIAKDYAVAGVNADGTMNPGMEAQAQLIASGKQAAPSGMAAARPGVGALMARVSQINPNYDATEYAAKLKAAKDFTSGAQGNSMRSFAVAGQHLDQLGQLVDALGNGNTQLVNKLGNVISQQTGSPLVTNFDAAKDVVSKEVVKAIVAGGGGVAEREELSKLMSSANSPAQLKGVIAQYRNLMSAQHDALLQQRRAAGLPDSTLPNYTDVNGSPAAAAGVPPDIAAILQKHGGK